MADQLDFQRRRLSEAALRLLPQAAVVLDERRSRPVWFDGLFLTAAALAREQSYVLSRQADLARTIGTGVVEGLEVEEVSGRPTALRIRRGHGLTPTGEPVVLERDLLVELADIPNEQRIERALGRPVRPTPPRENRSGLFVLALRPLEYTAEPSASYPTTIDEPRRLEDSVVREVALLTLVAFADAGSLGAPGLRRARAAERAFGGAGLDLPPDVLPVAALELAANSLTWLDVWVARREAGLAATDVLGLGLASEPVRAAHLRQYDAMLADLIEDRPGGGQELGAAEHFTLLPAAGRLPGGAVALTTDPATGEQVLAQGFLPPQMPVELTLVPEDEIAAVLEESLMLPPIRIAAAGDVLESQPVMILAPVPRADLGRLARDLGRLSRPLLPRHRLALAPSRPIELLGLLRARSEPRPAAEPAAAPEERAWADLVAARDTLWFARVRQLAAVDDLLPVLTPEVKPAPTAIVPERVVAGSITEVAIGGRRLGGASALTFDRDDIGATILFASDDLVRAEVRLLSSVPAGPLNFTLTTPRARLESVAFGLSLLVEDREPEPEPTLTGIKPGRVTAGTTISLAISGNHLENASALTVEGGDVVTAIVSATAGGVLAEVKASPNAAPGSRNFEVTTPRATLKSIDFGLSLVIDAAQVQPTLAAIEPDRLAAGQTIEATIKGQSLEQATSVAFDHRGMVVARMKALEDEVKFILAVDASVPGGPHNFVVTTPSARLESAAFGLALLVDDPAPQLTSIRPDRVAIGGLVTVVISGRGLDGTTDISFSPAGVTATIASATGSTVQAQVRVQSGAAPGSREFILTTARGRLSSQTFGLAFVVEEPPPLITSIRPDRLPVGGAATFVITGQRLDGATDLSFSPPGVTATISSATDLVVEGQVRVQSGAAPGSRSFALTTRRGRVEGGTLGFTFVVEELPPLLSAIEPGAVIAGTTVTVTISGRGLEGARSLDFDGAGVSAAIASSTGSTVQARVSAAASATVGRRNFVLTTPRGRLNSVDFRLSFTVASRYRVGFSSPVVGGDLV